jgi:AcrR family transcriptional regulator
MTQRTRTSPRKKPKQDRSRDTVDALLKATVDLLVDEGYERASTNRIALKAGVSIGSLYQYFPNKESLIGELIDRHYQEMADLCRQGAARYGDAPLKTMIREIIKSMVAVHALNPRLHLVLQEQVPRVGKLRKLDELHLVGREIVKAELLKRPQEVRVRDVELSSLFVVEVVDRLLHATLTQSSAYDEAVIVEEIADLLEAYLGGGPTPTPRRPAHDAVVLTH